MALAADEVKRNVENEKVIIGKMDSKRILSYFDLHSSEFSLDWNNASQRDWGIIKILFVSAYVNAYRLCSISDDGGMALNPSWTKMAETIIETSCDKVQKDGLNVIDKNIFVPLSAYFNHTDVFFTEERAALFNKITGKESTESHFIAMQRLIKYMALMFNFEAMFNEEKDKILAQHGQKREFNIQYVIARYHEQPVGFISCALNYKTSNVYLRYVTINPRFHRLHLGQKMLKEVEKHYQTSGLELYAREHNTVAKQFYTNYGFISTKSFWCEEPIQKDKRLTGAELEPYVEKWLGGGCIFPPLDDATTRPDLNIGFITRRTGMREI